MGQGGRIRVNNNTTSDMHPVDVSVSGMNWTLDKDIAAKNTTDIYIEFVEQPYKATTQFRWKGPDGVDRYFRLVVDGSVDYNIWLVNESVPSKNPWPTQTKGIPWRNDSATTIELAADPSNPGEFNFIII